MEIYLTSKFERAYKRLPKQVKEKAKRREKLFRQNPFHPILKTHPLHGKYKDYWSFSIDKSYRIMFQFLDAAGAKVAFINIGTHEIYK